ncbi:MAG: ATP-binding protein [Bacteroidales bacterium]|nr:ATP-binding protein [Bacteroidales bacterium]
MIEQILTDKIIAAAIVDRLTFKSFIVDMNAQSYRIRATEEWMKERKMKQKIEN